jgi:hypothetical protein
MVPIEVAPGPEALDCSHRLGENIGALNVELSPGDLSESKNAVSSIPGQGARYPEDLQKMLGR